MPGPDDYEDVREVRVAFLAGLNGEGQDGTLIAPINRVLLTQGHSYGPFGHWQYQQGANLKKLDDPEKRERAIAAGAVQLEHFDRAVSETPAPFFVNLYEDLQACRDEFERMSALLDEKCGSYAPPSSNIRNILAEIASTLETVASAALSPAGTEVVAVGDGQVTVVAGMVQSGPVQSREDAFRALLQVAEFFRRTEPHSPVSYALQQVVRWGRMPLPQLLSELIPESGTRDALFKWVGIQPSDQNGG
jgi:type VI secretion system protein ImpA